MKTHNDQRPRRVGAPLLWGASALSALLLVLASNGTLSAWTTAVITNSTNTVATGKAVILNEASGAASCSSATNATNVYTCTTINKYGGTATPLTPGTSQTVDVTFTNQGSANGTSFQLAPGTCAYSPTTGTPTPTNLCTSGDLTVAVSCSPGATYSSAAAWTDLTYAAAAPPTATKSHTAAGGDLNAGATWTCRFTVALGASAPVAAQNVIVSQPLTWTLNG